MLNFLDTDIDLIVKVSFLILLVWMFQVSSGPF